MRRDNQLKIPDSVNFYDIGGLSAESKELLERHKPDTIGQAGRIPGIDPAALVAVLRHIKKPASARMPAGRAQRQMPPVISPEERLLLNSFLEHDVSRNRRKTGTLCLYA